MTYKIVNHKSCCFTGHRPEKLPWGYNENRTECLKFKSMLRAEIEGMLEKGVTTFISGMAIGVDLMAAEIVLELKCSYPEKAIQLIAAIPFEGQADRWRENYRERYFKAIEQADQEVILQRRYTPSCMFERNRYMADRSAYMIAVYDGKPGGTKYTLDYALSKGLEVVTLRPVDLLRTVHPMRKNLTVLK